MRKYIYSTWICIVLTSCDPVIQQITCPCTVISVSGPVPSYSEPSLVIKDKDGQLKTIFGRQYQTLKPGDKF
jgi:hypothetical protein